jgi:hypothetical protein
MSGNALQLAGAQALRSSHYAPLWTGRFCTGLWTQRSPLRDAASTRMEEKFYGPRGDAFIDGSNIELSNRLTAIRRPGHTVYNSQTFNAVDFFYELRLFNARTEQIKVLADQADGLYNATGASTKSILWTKSAGAGQSYMQSVANCLFFGNGIDQKKLQNSLLAWTANTTLDIASTQTFLIDPNGNMQQLFGVFATVAHVAVASNVLTITCTADISAILAVDLSIRFSGLSTATWLNGQTVTITAVSGTTFTASFTNNFTHADTSVADTGKAAVLSGGTAITGTTQPTWNTTLLGKTYDGTIIWVNRGNPLQNWGIAAPSVKPTIVHGGQSNSWQPNTFYANDPVVIDSNGNLQKVTTAGTSSNSAPAWATSVGTTTTDGTAIWTMIQTAASLVWHPHTTYPQGQFIIGTAVGTPCLFKLEGFSGIKTTGAINAYLYNAPHSGPVGACILTFPTTTGSAVATASGNSFLFNPPANPNRKPVQWATLNGAGETTGYTVPFPSNSENYALALIANIEVPAPGQYTFSLIHQDGLIWGIGGGAEMVSGLTTNPIGQTTTAVSNFPVFGCTNMAGTNTDSVVVNFPSAGTYPIEIDWDYWYHSGQTLQVTVNGQNIIPDPAESGATQPIWPAWNTSFAPSYPTVSESQGALTWTNIGPVADYAWIALTSYITTADIIDPNNNTQNPYEAGKSGTTQPSFSTTFSGTTADNPNLLWINQGQASSPPTGTLTTVNGGWEYCISLVNTLDDTVSNVSPITAATGNFRASTGVAVSGGIPANYDPQVDYVAIFRTQDGGATFFLIPGPGNTPYTLAIQDYLANGYTDTTTDRGLNILLQAPTALQNTPPLVGVVNLTYHLGRIFVSLGNTVYWSTGPDTPIGNGTNGFQPINFATFPSAVKRMVPTSIGLLVFTVSDIYLGVGNATANSPLLFTPYLTGIGLLSYNALDVNGTLIYLFTADRQLIALDPSSGVSEVGFPIGDQLQLWDPTQVYVSWHVDGSQDKALYVANGSTGWYRLCPTPAPETGMMWSPFATITGGVKAVQSIEITPGVHKLLVGPTGSGQLLQRNLSANTDNGTAFTAFGIIGSLVLALPGQIAELSFLTTDASALGSRASISVLLDEISGTFEALPNNVPDPTQLPASASLYMDRRYFSQTQLPAICRHMQIKFAWPAEDAANELLSLTLYGGYSSEK